MSEQQQDQPAAAAAGGQPPDLEQIAVTKGERVAAVVGLLVLAALALICIDLATGGAISGRIGTVPAASTLPDQPCADC